MPAELLAQVLAPCVHTALCWLTAPFWEEFGTGSDRHAASRLDWLYFWRNWEVSQSVLVTSFLSAVPLLSAPLWCTNRAVNSMNLLCPTLIFWRSDTLWTFQGEYQQVSYPELFSQAWAWPTRASSTRTLVCSPALTGILGGKPTPSSLCPQHPSLAQGI